MGVKFTGGRGNGKPGWHTIGGRRSYYRSEWEANYAYYLEWLKQRGDIKDWAHEPRTFWFMAIKRGTRSFLPDFSVTDISDRIAYHEVKGWMDAASATKIKRMAKYYPAEKVVVVDSKTYRQIESTVGKIVPGWGSEGERKAA